MTGLHITELRLSHFRSHRAARVAVDARPVAIYGPNGAGKTNLLEAISLLSPGRGLRRAAAAELARQPEALGWKVEAVLQVAGRSQEVALRAEAGGARSLTIGGKPAPQVALARLARVLWLVPSMDRLWIEAAEGRRRFLDRTTMSFLPEHAEAVLTYEKAMRERNRLLKDGRQDAHWYAALEAQMGEAGARIDAGRRQALARLAAAQEDARTAFPVAELWLDYPEGAPPEDAAGLAEALAATRRRDMAAGRTLVGPHRADLGAIYKAKGVPARACSTGEQKALLVSLILANARALAPELGGAPILLLDEVAAHLDPARRAALYDEICALGAQAWMTGTEPGLFADLGARAQYLQVTEAGAQSRVDEGPRP